jgi:hypothetical protein
MTRRFRTPLFLRALPVGALVAMGACSSPPSVSASAGDAGDGGGSSSSCPLAIAQADSGGGQCLCASSANVLHEPGFDGDVSAWEQNGGAYFSPTDATMCAGSGSLQVMVDPTGGSQTVMNAQCVPVSAGKTYDFGARVLLPVPLQSTGASIGVEWIEFADCHGSFTTTAGPVADPTRAGSWQALSGSAVAPATAAAAYLTIQVTAPQGMSTSALFDDVYLAADPGTF